MSSGNAPDAAASVLAPELLLFEYGTCGTKEQREHLFSSRFHLKKYLDKKWLTKRFVGDDPNIFASHYVGVLPFLVGGKSNLLLIAPKGCQQDADLGLLRFLELIAFEDGKDLPKDTGGWAGQLGPNKFLLFLAGHYAALLGELCRRDFRYYYRAEEGELRGFIRGRLRPRPRATDCPRQAPHPAVHWDEFTADNWDNRILWAAARRLRRLAAALDPQAAAAVWKPFRPLRQWFDAVAEVPVTTADFHRSRLGRTYHYYRRALVSGRLLLREATGRRREARHILCYSTHPPPLKTLWIRSSGTFAQFPNGNSRTNAPRSSFRDHTSSIVSQIFC